MKSEKTRLALSWDCEEKGLAGKLSKRSNVNSWSMAWSIVSNNKKKEPKTARGFTGITVSARTYHFLVNHD